MVTNSKSKHHVFLQLRVSHWRRKHVRRKDLRKQASQIGWDTVTRMRPESQPISCSRSVSLTTERAWIQLANVRCLRLAHHARTVCMETHCDQFALFCLQRTLAATDTWRDSCAPPCSLPALQVACWNPAGPSAKVSHFVDTKCQTHLLLQFRRNQVWLNVVQIQHQQPE